MINDDYTCHITFVLLRAADVNYINSSRECIRR